MQYYLRYNLDKTSHHDSNVINISILQDNIIISFDWGFVSNFESEGPIVIDENLLELKLVSKENFYSLENSKRIKIQKPHSFESSISLIAETQFVQSNEEIIFTLCGFLEPPGKLYYIEWEITCKSAELKWNRFIRHEDWLNGTSL